MSISTKATGPYQHITVMRNRKWKKKTKKNNKSISTDIAQNENDSLLL